MGAEEHYIGNELELFEKANNWKQYYGSFLKPFIKGDVLEVGAGIGGTTKALCSGNERSWTCLEPDASLLDRLKEEQGKGLLPAVCKPFCGLIQDLPEGKTYDTILYIDVIEHIEDDKSELIRAFERLKPGGKILIIVPAHNFLFSPFDRAIGHYRRYNISMLRKVLPVGGTWVRLHYLDSVGLAASLANKMMLQQKVPTAGQIAFWDKKMIPVSRVVDSLFFRKIGKTVLGIISA